MTGFVLPKSVTKRDGGQVRFDSEKIRIAVARAAFEVLQNRLKSESVSRRITQIVLGKIAKNYPLKSPAVEAIQDIVEETLMSEGYNHIARNYILYRERRKEIRIAKSALGVKDDLKLSLNAMEVLKKRYLLKDENKKIIETPSELFRRVAYHVSRSEKNFKAKEIEERFYLMMRNLEFLPNSPTLMNAGTTLGQLSACFVLPVEDSIEGIFETLKNMAIIHQTGGGTGFSFSRLRPKADLVNSTKAEASGPVSFMRIFNEATGVIIQGGRRRGANMGILRCDHPDILEFIEAKAGRAGLDNFNLSIGITDKFMDAAKKDRNFALINPRTGCVAKTIKARVIFDLIVNAAWRTGDPGLIFLDEINRKNPLPALGAIEATNPCGELPLLPFESCNLGSINLSRMVLGNALDWAKLKQTIHWAVRFLDDVIEVNKFALPQIKQMTLRNRKIGLGVMGFADALIKLGIAYDSERAVVFAEKLMRFIRRESLNASVALAKERGVFPNFKQSIYARKGLRLRHATLNTIAPTGSISIIANCSSGIEPLFSISFIRNVLSGTMLFEINPVFEEMLKQKGLYKKELLARISQEGSLRAVKGIPAELKKVFVTAFDVNPQQHLKIQAAFQKYTDNSVSKTINLPYDATVEDVRKIYWQAYSLGCKGITIYRYASKQEQVLSFGQAPNNADNEYLGSCAAGQCVF